MTRWRWTALALLGVTGAYTTVALSRAWVAEDAFITFRYARNMIEGSGLRFNPADQEPIEGYSNFLWLLLSGASEAAGMYPGSTLNGLNALCGVLTLFAVFAGARLYLGASACAAAGAVVVLAVFPPFVCYGTSGLEVMPFTMAFLLASGLLIFSEHRLAPYAAGVAMTAAILLRTEGVYWLPVLVVLATIVRYAERRPIAAPLWAFTKVAGIPWMVYTAWRLGYYGTLISNTAATKVDVPPSVLLTRGLRYVLSSAAVLGLPLLLALTPLLLRGSERRVRLLVVAALAVAFPAWSVLVGGDYMPFFRFLVPSAPFLALFVAMVLHRIELRRGMRWAVATTAVLAGFSALPLVDIPLAPNMLLKRISYVTGEVEWRNGTFMYAHGGARPLGLEWMALKEFADEDTTVVLPAIGRNGYFTDAHLIDQCGLIQDNSSLVPPKRVGRRAGHDKCLPATAFRVLRPDVLVFKSLQVPPETAPAEIRRKVDSMVRGLDRNAWYADFVGVKADPDDQETIYGVGLRRATTVHEAMRGWQDYETKLQWLRLMEQPV